MTLQRLLSYTRKAVDDYGLIEDGDKINIDINKRTMNLLVSDEKLEKRREKLKPFELKCNSGYLAKYAKNVQDASHGAIV